MKPKVNLEDIRTQASVLEAMSMYLAIVDTDETVMVSAKKLAKNLAVFVEMTSSAQTQAFDGM
jgi:hypothetical protein